MWKPSSLAFINKNHIKELQYQAKPAHPDPVYAKKTSRGARHS
ncbi:Hypothetical protein ACI5QM_01347 [Bacillus subtilis]